MPFKVTNVISSFNSASGGPPRTVALISRAGLSHWRTELYTTNYLESADDTLLLPEFSGHVNLLPASAHSILGGLWQTVAGSFEAQLLLGIQPDIVHIHGMWRPLLAAFARTARRHRIPYIVATHGMLDPWCLQIKSVRKNLALRSYQGAILAAATAIHTSSQKEAENLRRLPCVSCPVYVIPNAVDAPTEPYLGQQASTDPKILLYLSRLHPQKGLDMLLQVWGDLRPSGWELAIAGGGAPDYVDGLRRWCASHNVSNVRFHGQVNGERRELMFRRASAFVLPSYSENFGNAVAEALMRGLPVLTTTGTPWSLLPRLRCGWYVEAKPEPLKGALGELLSMETEALRAMGQRGRDYARANFSIDTARASLLEMYHAAMGRVGENGTSFPASAAG
jgi:glycosyltransferase involved in cell wall biosynthesis